MRNFALTALLLSCLVTPASIAADLLIKSDNHQQAFGSEKLLTRTDVKPVDIPLDPAYKKPMHYRAVPLASLLQEQGINPADDLNFVALDGFTATLPAAMILNSGKSEALLAIENSVDAWPPLSDKSKATAGPFYLVWKNPEANGITQEQWPFQIARIEKVDSIAKRFPMLPPNKSIPENSDIRKGFIVFQKNCLVCHTLNGGGDGTMGPDLNVPHNPTEYFQAAFLKMLIRNPKQVRAWPDSKMPGFDEKTISDVEIEQLIGYLRHMKSEAARR
jgi:mono/diheme cytochrome c family protein